MAPSGIAVLPPPFLLRQPPKKGHAYSGISMGWLSVSLQSGVRYSPREILHLHFWPAAPSNCGPIWAGLEARSHSSRLPVSLRHEHRARTHTSRVLERLKFVVFSSRLQCDARQGSASHVVV
jgi:hypothetical protein